jgi:hypothetical protein
MKTQISKSGTPCHHRSTRSPKRQIPTTKVGTLPIQSQRSSGTQPHHPLARKLALLGQNGDGKSSTLLPVRHVAVSERRLSCSFCLGYGDEPSPSSAGVSKSSDQKPEPVASSRKSDSSSQVTSSRSTPSIESKPAKKAKRKSKK